MTGNDDDGTPPDGSGFVGFVRGVGGDAATPGTTAPRISVLLYARNARRVIADCLDSLSTQENRELAEVLLADASTDGTAELVRERYPWVRVLPCEPASMPAMRKVAIAAARGDLLALLDAHDVAGEGWYTAILRAHEGPNPAYGGRVEFDGPPTAANLAAYFFEYGAFAAPLPGGPAHDLPGNNSAYKRAWLEQHCADILADGWWKIFCHYRIQQQGYPLLCAPDMVVYHRARHRFFDFAVRRFQFARCFGGRRKREVSRLRGLYFTVFAPALPPLLFYRIFRRSWSKGTYRRELLKATPCLFLDCTFWAWGEFLGYLLGCGDACAELYEIEFRD